MNIYFHPDIDKKQKRFLFMEPKYYEMLAMISNGFTAKECSKELKISSRTIEARLVTLREEFECKNTIHLIAELVRKGIIK